MIKKISNYKVVKNLFLILFLLIVFSILLTTKSKATEIPKISIDGKSTATVTGTLVDSYKLTIDYSEIVDLTNLQLYYRIDNGTWKTANYDPSETSVDVMIRSGNDGFMSDVALHTISVYAENDFGKSETIDKSVLFYYYAGQDLSDTTKDVSVETNQFPLNLSLEVEVVTDPDILSKIPLLNMTLYKISIKADTFFAGPLLVQYIGDQALISNVSIIVPLSEAVKKAIADGVSKNKVGYSLDADWNFTRANWNFARDSDNYFEFIDTYNNDIYNVGYQYLAIATGVDSDDSKNSVENNNNNKDTVDTNNNIKDDTIMPGILPKAGTIEIVFVILLVGLIGLISVIRYNKMRDVR